MTIIIDNLKNQLSCNHPAHFFPEILNLQNKLLQLRRESKIELQNGDLGLASAPSNIALIKYWGKQEGAPQVPLNSSVSFTLGSFRSLTRIQVCGRFSDDVVQSRQNHSLALGRNAEFEYANSKMQIFLDHLLEGWADDICLRIESENTFPTACGIASSASGYAAMVGAIADLLQLQKHWSELDLQAWLNHWSRIGSGSACRSVALDGTDNSNVKLNQLKCVAWIKSPDSAHNYSEIILLGPRIASVQHCVIVVNESEKKVLSSEGHSSVRSSPLQALRLANIENNFKECIEALKSDDFETVARLSESDAFAMHSVMQSSVPPLRYIEPLTAVILEKFILVRNKSQAKAFWTLDAGPNPHFIYLPEAEMFMKEFIKSIEIYTTGEFRVLQNISHEGLTLGLQI